MTKEDPRTGEAAPRRLVAVAERQLAACAEALDAAIEDIRAGNFGPARDFAPVTAALRKALEAVFSERAKLEKIAQQQRADGATGAAGTLDLAAARAEVRRRMARLRATLGAGAVPEEPEP